LAICGWSHDLGQELQKRGWRPSAKTGRMGGECWQSAKMGHIEIQEI